MPQRADLATPKKNEAQGDDPTVDPRETSPHAAQDTDPKSGVSDDPRVDPTPDNRQSA